MKFIRDNWFQLLMTAGITLAVGMGLIANITKSCDCSHCECPAGSCCK